ncbi:MAG: hypothetical protein KDC34_02895 [Saprospiraceae bacterium]|nr:hypothetical protein [Saprospiraceae bacterium]
MKRLSVLLTFCSLFLFTGCIEILEEIYLNKGGSGKYQIMVDMSALMDESVQDMLGEFGGEEGANSLKGIELDSVINFSDSAADQIKALDRPEVFEGSQMRMAVSDSRDEMVITISMNFKDLSDIEYFSSHLSEIAGEGIDGGMSTGLIPEGTNYLTLKGKKLTRHAAPEGAMGALSEEELSMAQMFFQGATFTSVYHFPGKVKKTTIPGAEIDGNKVTIVSDMLEVMSQEIDLSGDIQFKWK